MKRHGPLVHLPVVLSVALNAAACPDDGDDDTTTAAAGTTASDTGTVDCAAILDMPACDADATCMWEPSLGFCVTDCATIADLATCNMEQYCFFIEDECRLVT